VVVVEIEGVVQVVPVPKAVPPELAENQEIVPDEAVAPKETVPEPFLEPGAVLVIVGVVFTVIVAVLFELIAELQLLGDAAPLNKFVIVSTVAPEFKRVLVKKFPTPGFVTVILAVFPVAELGDDRS
jgi:hypothetical protein